MAVTQCTRCGSAMRKSLGEFRKLGGPGPAISIVDTPAFICCCGASSFSNDVLRRLSVILETALDFAEAQGSRELSWAFTAAGPPEVGGFSSELRASFARLRDLVAKERSLVSATRLAAGGTRLRLH